MNVCDQFYTGFYLDNHPMDFSPPKWPICSGYSQRHHHPHICTSASDNSSLGRCQHDGVQPLRCIFAIWALSFDQEITASLKEMHVIKKLREALTYSRVEKATVTELWDRLFLINVSSLEFPLQIGSG